MAVTVSQDPFSEPTDYVPTEAPEVSEKKVTRRELDVAIKVRQALGKPMAAMLSPMSGATVFYSYTPDQGWVEDEYVGALADAIHGSNATRILGILGRRFALPTGAMGSTGFFRWSPDPKPQDLTGEFFGRWKPFMPQPHQVFFADGWVDLETNEYHDYTSPIFGPMITVPLDFDATSPAFIAAVERHFENRPDELRRFQQEMGKILQPHVPNKYELYLISETRDNGKSSLINAIANAPAGRVGFSTMNQKKMAEEPFSLAGLVNKFANVSSDSGTSRAWSNTLLELTSGPVTVRYMYKMPFMASLGCKLLNTCNTMQALDDRAGNMSNRMKVIELNGPAYPRDVKGGDQYLNVAYWDDARTAIVAWMYKGLKDLWDNGPVNSVAAKAQVENRINEADPERARFLETIEPDPNSFISSSDLTEIMFPGHGTDQNARTKFGRILSKRMSVLFGLKVVFGSVEGKTIRGYRVRVKQID